MGRHSRVRYVIQPQGNNRTEQMRDIIDRAVYFVFKEADADLEKPLPMIYQSGYLTIKDCDLDMGTFLLDFPNDEVKKGSLLWLPLPRQEL